MEEKTKNGSNHLGLGRLMLWKSSDVAAAGVQAIVLTYLSIYCTDTLGISTLTLGTLLLVCKVVNSITGIFSGWLVDNTKTKLGKGRTYELCIIGVTVCTLLMFSTRPEWSNSVKCIYIFFMYTLVFSVFSSLRSAANNVYCIRAFSNNKEIITKVSSFGAIITMFSSIVVSMVFPIVMTKIAINASGWTKTVAIFMVPLTLISILRFLFIKEDPSVDAGSQYKPVSPKEIFTMFKVNRYVWIYAGIMLFYNLTTSLGVSTYYFKWIIGDTSKLTLVSLTSIILLPIMVVFPKIMKKIGTMGDMIALFCVISIGGYFVTFLSGSDLAGVLIGYIIANLAGLPIAYYGVLFIMNCCSYNEMKGLQRMDASANILSSLTSQFGSAMGSLVTGIMLGVAGYASGEGITTQPESALMMIRVIFAIVPAISIAVIGICCKMFAPLEKKVLEWEKQRKAEPVNEK